MKQTKTEIAKHKFCLFSKLFRKIIRQMQLSAFMLEEYLNIEKLPFSFLSVHFCTDDASMKDVISGFKSRNFDHELVSGFL